MMAAVKTKLCS